MSVDSQEFIVYPPICDSVRMFSENFCDKLQCRHTFVKFETQDKTIAHPFPSSFLPSAQLSGKADYLSSKGKQW